MCIAIDRGVCMHEYRSRNKVVCNIQITMYTVICTESYTQSSNTHTLQ